jgi:hypothetical protein
MRWIAIEVLCEVQVEIEKMQGRGKQGRMHVLMRVVGGAASSVGLLKTNGHSELKY